MSVQKSRKLTIQKLTYRKLCSRFLQFSVLAATQCTRHHTMYSPPHSVLAATQCTHRHTVYSPPHNVLAATQYLPLNLPLKLSEECWRPSLSLNIFHHSADDIYNKKSQWIWKECEIYSCGHKSRFIIQLPEDGRNMFLRNVVTKLRYYTECKNQNTISNKLLLPLVLSMQHFSLLLTVWFVSAATAFSTKHRHWQWACSTPQLPGTAYCHLAGPPPDEIDRRLHLVGWQKAKHQPYGKWAVMGK